MTLDEARAELGIDASATPKEARRAYLRGVKVRKPETDPEGFRRLREAYEIVTGALARPQVAPGPEEEEEDEAPEIATLAARLRDLPAETHLEERLAALREVVRDHPKSLGVRWWLIQELGRAGRDQEVLDELFQGEADGLPGFLESRALNFPGSVGPEDLARLEASGSPEVLAIAVRVHLEGSRYDEAAAALGRALDRMAEWDKPALQPVPEGLPRGILALEAAGRARTARALHDRLWGWLSGTGDAALLKLWGSDFFWRFAHELGQLDPAFPSKLRRAAAVAALDQEGERAVEEAKRFAQSDAERAEQVSAMLYDLPILYSLYFRTLQGVGPGQLPPPTSDGPGNVLFTILIRFLLPVYLLSGVFSNCPHDPLPSPRAEPPSPMAIQSWRAWELLGGACDPARPKLPPRLCDAARLAVLKAKDGDCKGAQAALDEMSAQSPDLNTLSLTPPSQFHERMLSMLHDNCEAYRLRTEGRSSP